MASDDFVRSMMLGGDGPPQVKQELRVASPMNDLQLLALMSVIVGGWKWRYDFTTEDNIDLAIQYLGKAAERIRDGSVIAAVRGQPDEVPPQ